VELWSYLAINKNQVDLEDLPEFYLSHPSEHTRAQYLEEVLPEAHKIYEEVIKGEGKAIPFNFKEITNKLDETVQNRQWFTIKLF
ncbi:10078_t:CDS:1, partial [Cetraspora pellucida]